MFIDVEISGSHFHIFGLFGIWGKCTVFVFHLSSSFTFGGISLNRDSFPFADTKPTNKLSHNNNTESAGQMGWDLGFPALHRHCSGTGRKDTQNGKRRGN